MALHSLGRVSSTRSGCLLRPTASLTCFQTNCAVEKSFHSCAASRQSEFKSTLLLQRGTHSTQHRFGHCSNRSLTTPLLVSPRPSRTRYDSRVVCDVSWRGVSSDAAMEDSNAYREALPFEKIPKAGGLCALPYIGTRFLFKPFSKYPVESIGHVLCELHDALGPIYCLRSGKEWVVHIDNLEDAEAVLRSEEGTPFRKPILITQVYNKRVTKPVITLSILNGPEWKRLRSPMNVRMNRPSSVAHYLPIQEEVAVDFADKLYHLQGSDPAVLTELFFKFATESVGVVAFNKRLGFLDEDSEYDASKQKLLKSYKANTRCVAEALFGKRFLYILYEDSFFREYAEAKETIGEYAYACIKEAVEEIARREREGTLNTNDPNFLLSLLAERSLSEQDVFSIVDTLMAAGSDSTACGLQLLFYALATNPDKQEKVAEEVLTHMGRDGHLTAPVLDKLAYMTAAVKESMRLFFPVPSGAQRRLPNNAVLSGYQVPKGTIVGVNSLRIAISPRYYDQPNSFVPERWLRNEGGQRTRDISTMAYLPFGFGARNCVGRRFALQEIYLATAKMLQKYRLGLKDECGEVETIFTPFRAPRHPLPFTITPRE
ncbi:probable cytochrome P450 CYP44 [Littorina saxatilis]|uniref:probable cytochrome P450 CYP44 n=1 Tax=Littorina saxatilis TaxID=31220 RepID=UPI0038B517BB